MAPPCEWYRLVLQPEIAKKSIKPSIWRLRSFKVIEFGANREPVYDFLLVNHNNLGPVSHRYWDTATYWLLKLDWILRSGSWGLFVDCYSTFDGVGRVLFFLNNTLLFYVLKFYVFKSNIERNAGQKSQILPTRLLFSAFGRGDPLWIYGKALRFLKVESFRQPTVKIWWF